MWLVSRAMMKTMMMLNVSLVLVREGNITNLLLAELKWEYVCIKQNNVIKDDYTLVITHHSLHTYNTRENTCNVYSNNQTRKMQVTTSPYTHQGKYAYRQSKSGQRNTKVQNAEKGTNNNPTMRSCNQSSFMFPSEPYL